MTVMHPGDKYSSTVCRSHRRLLGAGFSVCLIWNDPCLQSLSVVLYAAYLAELNSGGDGISDFLFKGQPSPPFAGKLARNLVMVKCVRKPGSVLHAAVTCVVFL